MRAATTTDPLGALIKALTDARAGIVPHHFCGWQVVVHRRAGERLVIHRRAIRSAAGCGVRPPWRGPGGVGLPGTARRIVMSQGGYVTLGGFVAREPSLRQTKDGKNVTDVR